MKTKSYRLTLDVEIDPNGETPDHIERQLHRVVSNAVNNGLLTGNTSATVERYEYSIKDTSKENKERSTIRQSGEHRFVDCGGSPRCATCGADEDDAFVGGASCTYKGHKK